METIDFNVNCDGMLTLLTFARGVINGIWMMGGVNPSPYVYKVLAYEDVEFFYKLLTLHEDSNLDFLNLDIYKLFPNLEAKFDVSDVGFMDKTILHAGYNFLDIIRISSLIDILLDYNIFTLIGGASLSRNTFNCIINNTYLADTILLSNVQKKGLGSKSDKIREIKHMLNTILYGLNVKNWARVCEILQKKMNLSLFEKLSNLTSLEEALTTNITEKTIKTYTDIFPCFKNVKNISNCPLYKYYLTMGERFGSSLQSILKYRQDRIIIRNFLEWLKAGVFKPQKVEEKSEKETKEEMKEEVKEIKQIEEAKEEAKDEEMKKEMEEVENEEVINSIIFMVEETKVLYNNLKKRNEDLCEQYCKNREWFVTKENCKIKCLNISQFINILRSMLDLDVDNYKFNKVLGDLKKGEFNINGLEFHEILDIWTLFRDLQELKIDKNKYADIINQMKNQPNKQTKKHKPGMYAFKKHGGNHIKRTHKKKHERRKSIRNLRHNRRRTRKA